MCKMNAYTHTHSTQEQQLERLMARDSLSQEEALQRVNAQMPLSEKVRKADIVLDNSCDKALLRQQAYNLYHELVRITVGQRRMRYSLLFLVCVILIYLLFSLLS